MNSSRFEEKNDQYLDDLISNYDSKSTKKKIQSSITTFTDFLKANGIDERIEDMNAENLDNHLRVFWRSIKKNSDNGPLDYKISKILLKGKRYRYQRH